jgi:hypothetical protein
MNRFELLLMISRILKFGPRISRFSLGKDPIITNATRDATVVRHRTATTSEIVTAAS